MKLRLANTSSAAAHYVLAYVVALPIFLVFTLAQRLLRRGWSGPDERRAVS